MIEYTQEFLQLLDEPFMQRAVIGGFLVSIATALVGIFATLKKESFIADGVAHASLSGVALGLLVAGQPILFALVIAVLMSIIITYIKLNTTISADAAIGVFLPFFFSIGILLLFLRDQFSAEVETYLFGKLVLISTLDVVYASVATALVVGIIVLFYKQLLLITFDKEAATLQGINVAFFEYLYGAMVATVIIVSVKLVGIILVTGLFTIPASNAKLFARKFSDMIPFTLIHAIIAFVIGIFLSINYPPGPVIVLSTTSLFLLGLMYSSIQNYKYEAK